MQAATILQKQPAYTKLELYRGPRGGLLKQSASGRLSRVSKNFWSCVQPASKKRRVLTNPGQTNKLATVATPDYVDMSQLPYKSSLQKSRRKYPPVKIKNIF